MKSCPLCNCSNACFERSLNSYTLLKCSECDFVYADISVEQIEEINSLLDDDFSHYFAEQCQSSVDAAYFRTIAKRYTRALGPGRVLDVGCGNCLLLKCFRELGWECVGVDLSPWSEKFAKKNGCCFYHGRLEDQSFEPKSFDLVLSTSTLEHIAEPLQHLETILGLVRAGGRAYFSGIPNYASLELSSGLVGFGANSPPHHPNYFTPKTLRALIDKQSVIAQSYFIKTYGLSSAIILFSCFKKGIGKVSSVVKPTPPSMIMNHSQKRGESPGKELSYFHTLISNAYVMAGRPFSMGSKLEMEISF